MIKSVADGPVDPGPERPDLVQPPHRVDRVAQQHHREVERRRDQQRGTGEAGVPDGPVRPVAPGIGSQPPAQHARLGARARPPGGHERDRPGPQYRVPGRREQRAREPAQVRGRPEQPGVPADPAEREGVTVMHAAPDHARAGSLVAVGLSGGHALWRRLRPVAGRGHAQRAEHLTGDQFLQRLAGAFFHGPSEQHETHVAVADLTGNGAGQLRGHRSPDLGRVGAGFAVGPVRHQPRDVQQALADGDRRPRCPGQPPSHRVIDAPPASLVQQQDQRQRRHDLGQRGQVEQRVGVGPNGLRERRIGQPGPAARRRIRAAPRRAHPDGYGRREAVGQVTYEQP